MRGKTDMIGRRLGSFTITAKIGQGGMGEVFRATDSALGRDIALKILPHDVATDPERLARFKREARALASLSHPNIVTIHSVEHHDRVHFFTMELLEGSALGAHIPPSGLDPSKFLSLAIPVAEALVVAHEHGIVHRDLKPSNIVLDRAGRPKVVDFGLAGTSRIAEGEGGGETLTSPLTERGVVVGTAPYMSPEQAIGHAVDARSDIFSLGCVLYEMITGRLPFRGATPLETIDRIRHATQEPMNLYNATASPEVERIVRKCLEKEPGRRYQTAGDLLSDLRNLERDSRGPAPAAVASSDPTVDSIAILPFHNETADPDVEYLCDGLAETLINTLSQLPSLKVISRTSSFAYKGRALEPQAVGRDLNVRALLLGRLTQRRERLLVSAELVDVRGSHQLWGGRFNRPIADVFDIEEELAGAIAEKLSLKLSGQEQSLLKRRHTDDPQAYQLYLKARQFVVGTPDQMKRSLEYIDEAVRREPGYALAHATRAELLVIHVMHGLKQRDEAVPLARESVARALALEPHLAEAHTVSGMIKYAFDWDWQGAEADYRRGIELSPGSSVARLEYSEFLSSMGRLEESIAEAKIARELDPLSSSPAHWVAFCLMAQGQYDDAVSEFKRTLELYPHWVWGWIKMSRAYQLGGRCDDALAAAGRAVAESQGNMSPLARSWLACVYARCGRRDLAEDELSRLEALAREREVDSVVLATTHAALGNEDRSFDYLERAYEERSVSMVYLPILPRFDRGLSSHPRYLALMKQMGLR